MNVKGSFFLVFLLPFFYASVAMGQFTVAVDHTETPLKEVLQGLEQEVGLLFSYSEEVIAGKNITITSGSISLNALLQRMEAQTGLVFERLDDTQVLVVPPDKRVTICGYLFDRVTKRPLPYATLLIKGTAKGLTTDDNGYFLVKDELLDAHLLLQYVGYAPRLLKIADFNVGDCKNIFLNPQSKALEEVVVRSYLTRGVDKNKDGSLVVRSEDLGVLPGLVEPDIFQSIQWVPGISSTSETVSDVQIRGGSADQNLILFDDIKMYNTGHFFGMVSLFNPNVTTTATVLKGGTGPQYGDRISGVLDIRGETGIPEQTRWGMGLNGTQADTFVKARLGEGVGLVLSARRSYADVLGFETPTYNAIFNKVFQNTVVIDNGATAGEDEEESFELESDETFFFYDMNAKFMLKPSERDSVYISALLTRNDLSFLLREEDALSQDILVTENQGVSVRWDGVKARSWNHGIKGYYSHYDSGYTNLFFDDGAIAEESRRGNTVKDFGVDAFLTHTMGKEHLVTLGYQWSNLETFYRLLRDEQATTDDGRDFDEQLRRNNNAHSIYGAYTWKPDNRGQLTLGLRSSRFSILENWYWEPRLNVEYPVSPSIRVKLGGEKRYQSISQLVEFEDTQSRLENGIWTLTDNEEFPLLESRQLSGGFLFDAKGWTVDVDLYTKEIQGLTSFTNGFTNASEEYSQGSSDVFGIDVLVKKRWGNYKIWGGYTYNQIDYFFEELSEQKFSGNNDVAHNLTLSNNYTKDHWQFSLGWNFRTGTPFTPVEGYDAEGGDIVFGEINSGRLPNYHRLDASVRYGFSLGTKKKGNGIIGLSLQNIYARERPLSVFYRVDENEEDALGEVEVERLEQLSLGFTPRFLVRFTF